MSYDFILDQFEDNGRIITYDQDFAGYERTYARFKVKLKPIKYYPKTCIEKLFRKFIIAQIRKHLLSNRFASQVQRYRPA